MANIPDLETKSINAIRFLSADGVQQANSGHPGLPMGTASIAYTLWTKHLRHNPRNPGWYDRDRFVLSGGHGSMLLYSLLYLTGYDVPLEQLKEFRQWGSITPGHPEYGHTPGVETTTGPLGQGFANGVGMAMTEAHLAALFNQPGHNIINHHTYAIVTDGDLMEGVSAEAASLAGHLSLGKLIYFYDDNRMSIDGSTEITFTEDRGKRFESYGWQVLHVKDGNNVEEIDQAIQKAKLDPRPSLIICRTIIGYGLPNLQNTASAHGSPPGDAELELAKENLDWPVEPRFFVPDDVLTHFRKSVNRGNVLEQEWNHEFDNYKTHFSKLSSEFSRRMEGRLPEDWDAEISLFAADPKGMASRQSSGQILNALAKKIPELVSGSADLTPSNNTMISGTPDFQKGQYSGRYIRYGVREHAMGAIINGLNIHKGVIAVGGTFLVFSDYMRPAVRLSALSKIQSIWIFTHDSIGLGEDGPTHQPVEHIAALRSIPDLVVIRPADANEVLEAWKFAIQHRDGPTALILSRQNLPTLDRTEFLPADGLSKGAYVLADLGPNEPELILMASGSEVHLAIEAGRNLAIKGHSNRIVSFPSLELFEKTDIEYQESILPPRITKRLAIEAGVSQGWHRWIGSRGDIICMNTFGASAPGNVLFEKFGFTAENVIKRSLNLLANQ